MAESIHGILHLLLADLSQRHSFRKVLTKQPVAVLVQAPRPRVVGVCEVDIRPQCRRQGFMTCEFFAVVEGNGVALILVWLQQACCHGCHAFGMLATDMTRARSVTFFPPASLTRLCDSCRSQYRLPNRLCVISALRYLGVDQY